MTNEEIAQVNTYILQLKEQYERDVRDLSKAKENETRFRKFAQADSLKMGLAVHEIWKLTHTQSTMPPPQFAMCVRQIINYYCPDFDVPF